MVEINQAQRSGRWVLPIAVSVFVAGAGLVGALNVYSIARIDTVGDRVNDTRTTTSAVAADVTVLKNDVDSVDTQVARIDARVETLDYKVDYLTATTLLVAKAVGISTNDLPIPREPDKRQ